MHSAPRFVRVKQAVEYAGVSRGRLYQWAQKHPNLFRKDGTSSFVDLDVIDQIHNALPVSMGGQPASLARARRSREAAV